MIVFSKFPPVCHFAESAHCMHSSKKMCAVFWRNSSLKGFWHSPDVQKRQLFARLLKPALLIIQKKTKFDSDIDGKIEMIIILEMVGKIRLPTMYFIFYFFAYCGIMNARLTDITNMCNEYTHYWQSFLTKLWKTFWVLPENLTTLWKEQTKKSEKAFLLTPMLEYHWNIFLHYFVTLIYRGTHLKFALGKEIPCI